MKDLTKLRNKLKPRRVTQTRVAELAGITVGQLNNIINGRRKLKSDVEEKIYRAYDRAWEELRK